MIRRYSLLLTAAMLCGLLPLGAQADSIHVYENAAGATPSVDRTATFDALTTGTSLDSYTEDGLNFAWSTGSEIDFSPEPLGFDGSFLYAHHAPPDPLVITTTDTSLMYGIQFNVGTGFYTSTPGDGGVAGADLPIAYQLSRGGNIVGSGSLDAIMSDNGYLLGLGDSAGFDTVEIYNCDSSPCTLAASNNGIAIDNVSADLTPTPEPASLWLLAGGVLVYIGGDLRRRRGAAGSRAGA